MERKPRTVVPREIWEGIHDTHKRLMARYPHHAAAAAAGSRKAAIFLTCKECTGDEGPSAVKNCGCADSCFLYPFRLGGGGGKKDDSVENQDLNELVGDDENSSDELDESGIDNNNGVVSPVVRKVRGCKR